MYKKEDFQAEISALPLWMRLFPFVVGGALGAVVLVASLLVS